MYKCGFCNKEYKKKTFFEKHIIACEALHSRDQDVKTEYTPSIHELWNLVKDLTFKVESQSREITKLKQHIQVQKRKVNITEWLTDNIDPVCDFSTFIREIQLNEYQYNDIILYDNIRNGITSFLKEHVFVDSKRRSLPIQCFKQFYNTFFIYKNEKWEKMNSDEMLLLCNSLDTKIFGVFQTWKQANQTKIDRCSKTNEYYMQIMSKLTAPYKGDNHDNHVRKIRSSLYQYWNMDLKQVVTYDYVM